LLSPYYLKFIDYSDALSDKDVSLLVNNNQHHLAMRQIVADSDMEKTVRLYTERPGNIQGSGVSLNLTPVFRSLKNISEAGGQGKNNWEAAFMCKK